MGMRVHETHCTTASIHPIIYTNVAFYLTGRGGPSLRPRGGSLQEQLLQYADRVRRARHTVPNGSRVFVDFVVVAAL